MLSFGGSLLQSETKKQEKSVRLESNAGGCPVSHSEM